MWGSLEAGENPKQKDDIIYIRNVTVGHQALDKAQYEQIVEQVDSLMYSTYCFVNE